MSVYPLVYQQPVSRASARPKARLDGLTDRVGVHQSVSPAPLAWVPVQGGCWIVQSRRHPDWLWSCPGNATARHDCPRPFDSNSFNMRPFDVRHPSRDALLHPYSVRTVANFSQIRSEWIQTPVANRRGSRHCL